LFCPACSLPHSACAPVHTHHYPACLPCPLPLPALPACHHLAPAPATCHCLTTATSPYLHTLPQATHGRTGYTHTPHHTHTPPPPTPAPPPPPTAFRPPPPWTLATTTTHTPTLRLIQFPPQVAGPTYPCTFPTPPTTHPSLPHHTPPTHGPHTPHRHTPLVWLHPTCYLHYTHTRTRTLPVNCPHPHPYHTHHTTHTHTHTTHTATTTLPHTVLPPGLALGRLQALPGIHLPHISCLPPPTHYLKEEEGEDDRVLCPATLCCLHHLSPTLPTTTTPTLAPAHTTTLPHLPALPAGPPPSHPAHTLFLTTYPTSHTLHACLYCDLDSHLTLHCTPALPSPLPTTTLLRHYTHLVACTAHTSAPTLLPPHHTRWAHSVLDTFLYTCWVQPLSHLFFCRH